MIYCDKCKKGGVDDRMKNIPEPPMYSMQDVVDGKNEGISFVTAASLCEASLAPLERADIKWHTRILECPYCGFKREYEYGSGGIRPTKINSVVKGIIL